MSAGAFLWTLVGIGSSMETQNILHSKHGAWLLEALTEKLPNGLCSVHQIIVLDVWPLLLVRSQETPN